MKPSFQWLSIFILLLGSCAQQDGTKPRQPLNEAYRLMDKGENAKAIYLLENYLTEYPKDKEARILAASAYMGEAGIDIYRSYDAFKDILFSLPLGEFLIRTPPPLTPNPKITGAPLEQLIGYMDLVLGKTKHIVSFLSRFPKVEPAFWPLIDRALEHMALEEVTNDERLYRTFVRVVYLKAFLDVRILDDHSFGSLAWLCRIELFSMKDQMIWATRHLYSISSDFRAVFPKQSGDLLVLHETLHATLAAFDHNSPAGANTAMIGFEHSLKEHLRCNTIVK